MYFSPPLRVWAEQPMAVSYTHLMIKTIGFLGCGNMGGAIARAVCKAADPQNVYLANQIGRAHV